MINSYLCRYDTTTRYKIYRKRTFVLTGCQSPDCIGGGADSVALLCILHTAGYHCEAAHCNFHLRGEESDRDELFVRQLCKRTGIHLHTIDFNTTQYAKEKQISIEMAARELRYDWFEKTRKECQADVIAVAHHQDDSVETILLNLIRGTGITGLLGIRPRNGAIVRPLLASIEKISFIIWRASDKIM